MPIIRNYNKDFFKNWSSEMAYVLGFLYADGNISKTKRGTHFIAIYSADKDILVKMQKLLRSDHSISSRRSPTGCVYRIQIGSKEWFCDLENIGLNPGKTKRLKLPNIPDCYFGDFVRGYFDGDGNVWVGKIHKNRDVSTLTIQVAFTSGSFDFLVSLRHILQTKGLQGGSVFRLNDGKYGRLIFSVRDAFKLYEIMYNGRHKLYLKRKQAVFDKFAKMRE